MVKKALSWIVVVIPPLILLPLVSIPFDLPTGFFWLIGGVAMFVSFCHIVYKIGQKGWATIFSRQYTLEYKTLLRPLLTIVVMLVAFTSSKVSGNAARSHALKIAEQVQSTCIKAGECPGEMPGWPKHGSAYVISAGTLMRFPIYYEPAEDRKDFRLFVRWSIDSRFVVTGGVNSKLKSEEVRSN